MPRRDNTPVNAEQKDRFLWLLADGASVETAAKAVGRAKQSFYRHRRNKDGSPTEFAAAWDQAYEQGTDRLEAEAQRRAVEGVPDFRLDKAGVEHPYIRYSDTLLIFLLKARRPERFRDNVKIEHASDAANPVKVEVELGDSARDVLRGLVEQGLIQPGPTATPDTPR